MSDSERKPLVPPPPSSEAVARTMRGNRARDTGPELRLRNALRAAGLTGYRVHWTKVPGKPDVAFVGKRLAVFVHGCYWHSCPHCQIRRPGTNAEYWNEKLRRNQERDERVAEDLASKGWRSITVWECQTKGDLEAAVASIKGLLVSGKLAQEEVGADSAK